MWMDLIFDAYMSMFEAVVAVAIGLVLYGIYADTEKWKEAFDAENDCV